MMFDHIIGLYCSLDRGAVCNCARVCGKEWTAEVQRFIDAGVSVEAVWQKSYAQCLEILPKEYPKLKRKYKIAADCTPEDLINHHHSETAIEFLAKQGILRQEETIQQPEYLYTFQEKANNANNLLP